MSSRGLGRCRARARAGQGVGAEQPCGAGLAVWVDEKRSVSWQQNRSGAAWPAGRGRGLSPRLCSAETPPAGWVQLGGPQHGEDTELCEQVQRRRRLKHLLCEDTGSGLVSPEERRLRGDLWWLNGAHGKDGEGPFVRGAVTGRG